MAVRSVLEVVAMTVVSVSRANIKSKSLSFSGMVRSHFSSVPGETEEGYTTAMLDAMITEQAGWLAPRVKRWQTASSLSLSLFSSFG